MNTHNEMLLNLNRDSDLIIREIPQLIYVGNELLRLKTSDVSLQEGIEIGNRLLEALLKYRNLMRIGVGLAAPQIGLPSNVFVTCIAEFPKIYINPKIISVSREKNLFKECCLSSGHLWCDVERPKSVSIQYTNENGELVTEDCADKIARVVQHEMDHLQGIVNLDRAVCGTTDYRFGDPKEQKIRE